MSEVAKPAEEAPAPMVSGGTDPTPAAPTTPATATAEQTSATEPATSATETIPTDSKDVSNDKTDTKVEATPASEGVLGYKSPGLIHSLLFSKRFFWFSDEAFTPDTLDTYLRTEKAENAHPNAAWASETGKGLLFFAKRAEDKSAPTGIINLSEISDVSQEGASDFSFKLNGHKHSFQASSTVERSSWIAAVEANATEAKASKEGIVSSEAYKKHLDKYKLTKIELGKMGVGAAGTGATRTNLSKSRERKDGTQRKSLETKGKGEAKKDKPDNNSSSSDDEKTKKAKSRSQSRKRSSIFGLLGKKDDAEQKKDVSKEGKVDEGHEGEASKVEETVGDDAAKEEPKSEHMAIEKEEAADDAPKPVDATESATPPAVAAAPAAVATSTDDQPAPKADEIKPETTAPKSPEVQDKKAGKRGSIFGLSGLSGLSLFGAKKDATSPSTEKTQGDTSPAAAPAKEREVPPVSDTAPKIDQPIQTKPIDTTAVTAPVDSAIAAHDADAKDVSAEQSASPNAKGVSSPSTHKSNIMGFFKRQDSKIEPKKEERPEEAATSPIAAETGAVSETPVATTTDEKPTAEKKRRTSFFNNFGPNKDKKSIEPTLETEATKGEGKKSPIPQKLGGLFRKASNAVKSEEKHSERPPGGAESGVAPTEAGTAQPAVIESAESKDATDGPKEATTETPMTASNTVPEVKATA